MANTEDKFRSLVEGLYLKSSSNELKWSKFSDSDSYVTDVGNTKIEVYNDRNSEGETLVTINIYNSSGDKIDSFDDEYFATNLEPKFVQVKNYFTLMSNLLEISRRNATGADKILDDILSIIQAPRIDSDLPDPDDIPF